MRVREIYEEISHFLPSERFLRDLIRYTGADPLGGTITVRLHVANNFALTNY